MGVTLDEKTNAVCECLLTDVDGVQESQYASTSWVSLYYDPASTIGTGNVEGLVPLETAHCFVNQVSSRPMFESIRMFWIVTQVLHAAFFPNTELYCIICALVPTKLFVSAQRTNKPAK